MFQKLSHATRFSGFNGDGEPVVALLVGNDQLNGSEVEKPPRRIFCGTRKTEAGSERIIVS